MPSYKFNTALFLDWKDRHRFSNADIQELSGYKIATSSLSRIGRRVFDPRLRSLGILASLMRVPISALIIEE